MNGNGSVAIALDGNANGISKPKSLGIPSESIKLTTPAIPTACIKEDFMDPIFGPKPGGISKAKSNLVDVICRNAVGPQNFIIQDYRQSENLRKLESTMTEFYTEFTKKNAPLDHIDIIPDGYYAAQLESHENWVRARVVKPFHYDNPQVMVFLLDHGSYSMTDAAHLRPLRRTYVEKLPSQAYRAKLHFLSAAGSQWTTDECNRFKSDVEGKPFCAIIVDEAKDLLFSDQIPIFSLVLIDTSGPQDRYVHQSYSRKR